MDAKIDNIEKILAEFKGGKAVGLWFFGFFGAIAGSIITWWVGK